MIREAEEVGWCVRMAKTRIQMWVRLPRESVWSERTH